MNKNTGRQRDRNTVTTKSGSVLKINRSIGDRHKSKKAERAAKRAAYLATLPKDRWKRYLYRLKPAHLAEYWFSEEGALMALKIIGATIVVCFFLTIGLFAYFRKDLPQIKDLAGDFGGSISYYDRTGQTLLFTDYNSVKREPVDSQSISPYMKEATVAVEDKNFYKEGAFDARGIIRAAYEDAKGGGSIQGGSTITQQLVKLDEGWTDNRTVTRKVKELILAVELERQYSKDDILTGYLNLAPYGGLDYGVQSAAQDYFQTDAKNLTLAQSAMLAAIPQSPSYYSPYDSPQYNPAISQGYGTFSALALLDRQHYILNEMADQGYITKAQAQAAIAVNVLAQVHQQLSKYQNIQAPYFVLQAKQQLIQQYGANVVAHGGWKVVTTLNTGLQQYAEQDVQNNEKNVASVHGDEEAMVAEDVQTGQVVAQVGGENFNDPTDGQIDYASTNISPGSSLKPFLYAALIQNNNNVGAGSALYDTQQPLPGYPCTDKTQPTATSNGGNCLWDDNFVYPGPESIRYALAGSRNVPAVKASYEVVPGDNSPGYTKSVSKWISMANAAMGYKDAYGCYQPGVNVETATAAQQTQCYGSAALGSGDVALDEEINGDATLARLGSEVPQTYILKITDSSNKTVYQWKQPKATQVYNPDTAYIVNSMLDDPRASYLQPYQKFQNYNGWNIAVKTGTENQEFNGVMTAWSSQYAVIGFAGYHTLSQPLEEGHFEDITEPITRTWMEQALNALHEKPVNWAAPKDIKTVRGFVQEVSTGFGAEVPGPTQDIYPSWYVGSSGSGSSETIDRVSGLVATSCTPAAAREAVYGGSSTSWNIDMFKGGSADTKIAGSTSSGAGVDNVHNCNDSPPTITLTAPSTCTTSCTITATATQGTHPLSDPQYPQFPGTITFTLGGKTIHTSSVSDSPSTVSFTYNPSSSGSGTLTATVTDSVLYSGSQSQTMAYSTPNSNPITVTAQTAGGNNYNVTWSGGTAPYTVSVNGIAQCSNTSANACSVTASTGSSISVSDNDDDSGTTTAP